MSTTNITNISSRLTEAQRKMIITGDDEGTSLNEYNAMFSMGIMSSNGMYELSDLGIEVRDYLISQENENG